MVLSGKLFTGRIYDIDKLRRLRKNLLPICIMRWPPRFMKLADKGIMHVPGLSPLPPLLKNYQKSEKTRDSWESFVKSFLSYLQKDKQAEKDKFFIRGLLFNGTDVLLLCHEKSDEYCHRHVVPYFLLSEEEMRSGAYYGELLLEDTIQTKLEF